MRHFSLALFLLTMLFGGLAAAETRRLVLRNGEEEYGEITVGPEQVRVVTPSGKVRTFPRSEVAGLQSLSGAGQALTPVTPGDESPTPVPPDFTPPATTATADGQAPTGAPGGAEPGAGFDASRPWYRRPMPLLGAILAALAVVGGLFWLNAPRARRPMTERDFRRGPSGCMWVLIVLAALAAAGGLYVYLQWRVWTGDAARETAETLIAQSDMNETDKARVRHRVARVIVDFEEERIGAAELDRLGRTFARGPLLVFTLVESLRRSYLTHPGLTLAEKAAGDRALQRWARGVAEGRIPFESMSAVFAPVAEQGADGRWHARDQPRVEEVRAMVAAARASADGAAIPDEPWKLDVAQAVIDLIDQAVRP